MAHNRRVPDNEETPDASPAAESRTPAVTMPEGPPRRATGLRVGYRADEVDAFLADLRRAVHRDPPAMAPYEVADARFRATRVRARYRMRSTDELLAQAQQALRHRHGEDAVADVEGHASPPRPVRTGWIYGVAVVLVVLMLAFALTQL